MIRRLPPRDKRKEVPTGALGGTRWDWVELSEVRASLNASKGDVENAESWLTKLKNPERLGGSGLSLY